MTRAKTTEETPTLTGRTREQRRHMKPNTHWLDYTEKTTEQTRLSLAGLESKDDRTNHALTSWTREQRRQIRTNSYWLD